LKIHCVMLKIRFVAENPLHDARPVPRGAIAR
jgi:hypothetical protein